MCDWEDKSSHPTCVCDAKARGGRVSLRRPVGDFFRPSFVVIHTLSIRLACFACSARSNSKASSAASEAPYGVGTRGSSSSAREGEVDNDAATDRYGRSRDSPPAVEAPCRGRLTQRTIFASSSRAAFTPFSEETTAKLGFWILRRKRSDRPPPPPPPPTRKGFRAREGHGFRAREGHGTWRPTPPPLLNHGTSPYRQWTWRSPTARHTPPLLTLKPPTPRA